MVRIHRPKHQNKELEEVLREAERRGWTVVKTTYFRCRCPCGVHAINVHLTPSGGRYLLNVTKQFERQACWKEER